MNVSFLVSPSCLIVRDLTHFKLICLRIFLGDLKLALNHAMHVDDFGSLPPY